MHFSKSVPVESGSQKPKHTVTLIPLFAGESLPAVGGSRVIGNAEIITSTYILPDSSSGYALIRVTFQINNPLNDGFHPVELTDNIMIDQKLEYPNQNPVTEEYVYKAEGWLYNSARFYPCQAEEKSHCKC